MRLSKREAAKAGDIVSTESAQGKALYVGLFKDLFQWINEFLTKEQIKSIKVVEGSSMINFTDLLSPVILPSVKKDIELILIKDDAGKFYVAKNEEAKTITDEYLKIGPLSNEYKFTNEDELLDKILELNKKNRTPEEETELNKLKRMISSSVKLSYR